MNSHVPHDSRDFLNGGGAMGEQLRAFPWEGTALGAPEAWPPALRTLVSVMLASNQPMFVAWGPGRILLYNEPYGEILGRKHPGALGQDFLAVWQEIRADLDPIVAAAFRGEPVQMASIPLVMHRHGYPEQTYFSFFYSPVRDEDGAFGGLFCACTDITAQVVAERRLRESEARHRGVLANMGEGFLLLDPAFNVLEVNDEALRLVGQPRDELVGRSHWDLYPDTFDTPLGRMYRRALAEGKPGFIENRYVFPDGRDRWFEVRAYPVTDGLALFFRDVTHRRFLDTEAVLSAERVELALDAGAIIGTWVWDVPSDLIVADERFAHSFDLDPEQCREGLALAQVMESIHPDDVARVSLAIEEALGRGGAFRCEYRVRQSEGGYRWIEANGRVEMDAAGDPVRFPGVLLDIENRRRAETERDRADALLHTFIEAVPGVVYAKDRDGRLIVANRGVAELFGRPPEEFIGHTDLEMLDDKEQARDVMANDRRIMETGELEQIEEEVRLADGTPAWWLSTKAPLRDESGAVIGLIGSSVDITERKLQQERAQVEADMLDVLNRTGASLAAELDLPTLLQRVTEAGTQLTGAEVGAFFYSGTEDDTGGSEGYTLYAPAGAPAEAFAWLGDSCPATLFENAGRGGPPLRIDDVLRDSRRPREAAREDATRCQLPMRSYLAVPVTSRAGQVLGAMYFAHPHPGVFSERSERLAAGLAAQSAVAIDNARLYAEARKSATERKRLLESERAARAEAERASRLKDEFLAALSHELRTPLSAIVGWLHVLRLSAGEDATMLKGVEVIERSTRAQTQLIEDLLDMSRITSGKLRLDSKSLSPAALVEAAIDGVRHAATAADVRIEVRADDDVPHVSGDPGRLQQVLWNLLSNAVKFSPRGGVVSVRLENREGWARITIRDHGIGIRPDFLPHVFDRFRQADGSTTRRFGGLGLGLSIARHLVDLHGGHIAATSKGEGHGTCFVVMLPSQSSAGRPEDFADLGMPAAGDNVDLAGIRVLLVDDDPDALELLTRVLREANAEVFAAGNAEAALLAMPGYRPTVLVSDIGMPGLDGFELIRRLRRLSRAEGGATPAIALTAFARAEDRAHALNSGFTMHLAKPVEPAQLMAHVAMLARKNGGGQAETV
jgi:PAS domain S-box-containing protein